jgi:hypothetical protein
MIDMEFIFLCPVDQYYQENNENSDPEVRIRKIESIRTRCLPMFFNNPVESQNIFNCNSLLRQLITPKFTDIINKGWRRKVKKFRKRKFKNFKKDIIRKINEIHTLFLMSLRKTSFITN